MVLPAAAALVLLTAFSCGPEDPDPQGTGLPPPPSVTLEPVPPEETPSIAPSPTPSQRGVAGPECLSRPAVLQAVTGAGVVEPGAAAGLAVRAGPVCAGGFAAALLAAPGADVLQVVLQRRAGSWYVLTSGSLVCGSPVVEQAPAVVRSLLGC